MAINFKSLINIFDGEIFTDYHTRVLYATDASAYREVPIAVTYPKHKEDIKRLITFALNNKTSLIPRTAGTSLAGQVVGGGIVIDVSKYFTQIIELNVEEKWVKVQPGVILDELNMFLAPHGLFFGPETSTSSRCMIGGMVGNNSCGSHSIIYGTTREHTKELSVVLSDGSEAIFGNLNREEFFEKTKLNNLEGEIYKQTFDLLKNEQTQQQIRSEFPDPHIYRRNMGYAVDLLINNKPFNNSGNDFNFCQLLAGSEGTLAFTYEIKLDLVEVPPKHKALVCAHFNTIQDALKANIIALKYKPGAVELMDDIILEATKDNLEHKNNRDFVKGEPKAILIIEFARNSMDEILELASSMETEMRNNNLGYHFPLVSGKDIPKVWALRKAGLGVLSNIPGDNKPVTVIEDTAVNVNVLPEYIAEFQNILNANNMQCVHYAHVGSGEIHLRPVLNLKDSNEVKRFHLIGKEIAKLVKKYNGSLSGEHGDGRLRGEFIPFMIGEENYQVLKKIKTIWDENNIFNPGKITDTPSMTDNLRYQPDVKTKEIETIFDFEHDGGIMRAVEKCNGSADCRKTEKSGGTMCPSYMATRNEANSTRARANTLREYLTNSTKQSPFDHEEIYKVMDLCLSCKACKRECPSSIDMAKLKAEFLQHYYDKHGIPLRTRLIAYISEINRIGMISPRVMNFFMTNKITSSIIKNVLGFAPQRTMPLLQKRTLSAEFKKLTKKNNIKINGEVYLFIDEFTNYNDTSIGIKTIILLNKLGYKVNTIKNADSGRTFISKGLIRKAKKIAIKNVSLFSEIISKDIPLIGIEPSTILSFRDEYPDLVEHSQKSIAKHLGENALLFEEFFINEVEKGNIRPDIFTTNKLHIKLHGHCQQKAVASTKPTIQMLQFPKNYTVEEIPSGCCGMAGSFGYEKEHYELSMKVGELVLFPAVRKTPLDVIIAAPGTSCRHQIKDGTSRDAKHPIEIIYEALN